MVTVPMRYWNAGRPNCSPVSPLLFWTFKEKILAHVVEDVNETLLILTVVTVKVFG